MLHLLKGPELKRHYWEDREEKNSQTPVGIWTRDLVTYTIENFQFFSATSLTSTSDSKNGGNGVSRTISSSCCRDRKRFSRNFSKSSRSWKSPTTKSDSKIVPTSPDSRQPKKVKPRFPGKISVNYFRFWSRRRKRSIHSQRRMKHFCKNLSVGFVGLEKLVNVQLG